LFQIVCGLKSSEPFELPIGIRSALLLLLSAVDSDGAAVADGVTCDAANLKYFSNHSLSVGLAPLYYLDEGWS
jgi:hypothetical protein